MSPPSSLLKNIQPTVSSHTTNTPTAVSNSTPDTEELAQFRQKWKEEVRRDRVSERARGRTGGSRGGAIERGEVKEGRGRSLRESMSLSPDRPIGASKISQDDMSVGDKDGDSSAGRTSAAPIFSSVQAVSTISINLAANLNHVPASFSTLTRQQFHQLSARQKPALKLYTEAVLEEQRGNHSEATTLYRRAYRLDSNVDKVYRREEIVRERTLLSQFGDSGSPPAAAEKMTPSSLSATVSPLSLAHHFGRLKVDSPERPEAHPYFHRSQTNDERHPSHLFNLTSLVSSWTDPVPEFLPSDERLPIPLNRIPNELIIYILATFVPNLDIASIEQFALVCRKTRVLALDGSIWRKFLELNLVSNQLSDPGTSIDELCLRRYRSDYRRMFIEHPRVRFDGVYIAICHYIRNGLGENPWVNVSHLITYRRFLRFFPNGKVLSYQANEDQDISEVVHSLHPSLAKKDFRLGDWQLLGAWLYISNLAEVIPSRFRGVAKYNFQMRLSLKSKPCLGKWNKLDLLDYDSVDMETGDVSPFALKHERPYWFSKVRSYAI